jgi:nucleoside-diphosphate-sugar epimerase
MLMESVSQNAALADRQLRHALVLGGSGYIGAWLVRTLAAAGIRTSCLVHRRPPPVPGVRALTGSIDRFRWRTLEDDPPDVVFHLARIPRRRRFDAPVIRARNRAASARLLYWLASCPRPPLAVFVGGTLAYGSHGEAVVTEETELSPVSFSRDYHAAEVPWLQARAGDDAPLIIARPAWVLGPGSWFETYYGRPIREERIVPLYGEGANWMSLVHVEDAAGLLLHLARRAPPMTVMNLATGPTLRQRELTDRLTRLTGLPIRPISLDEITARHGRAVREAFVFSARVETIHGALTRSYQVRHTDLDVDLAALLGA